MMEVQSPPSADMKRLDTRQAFIYLFAASFTPAFIVVDLATQTGGRAFYTVNGIMLAFILLTCASNQVGVNVLTRIQNHKSLGCYQEVAYWVSKGNRGYIYLISVMKVVYLVTVAGYCLQFVANYLTVLTLIPIVNEEQEVTLSANGVWGIFCAWLCVLSGGSLAVYLRNKDYTDYIRYAWAMFFAVIVSVVLLIVFLFLCISDGFREFSFGEICLNGSGTYFDDNTAVYQKSHGVFCCSGQI